ncbi:hypothetical protein BGZ63DRAFT_417601 [Mariannaea sp. PMI_226]|nr:hypothetical protein BGZ63DRAFT_417601 [Mariannaea sp. PMI_226]
MTNSDFTEIPVIDLLLADNVATRPQLLARLRSVLTEIGFLYVSNHGIPPAVIADLIGILPTLFALPDSAKAAIALHNSPHFLGYSAVGSETTAGRLDQREQVEFATELSVVNDRGPLYERLRGPNQWPAELPNLRPIVERYIAELTSLGERFLRLVAEALSLPTEAFLSYLSDQHRLKLVRYPPSSTQGVGPHKDSSGWWTFLLQASPNNVRGLQVLNKAGAWIDVPALPGTLVVNIGQAFEVVTHGNKRVLINNKNMAFWNRNNFTAKSGNNYSYVHRPPAQGPKNDIATLLFLHGFPSTLDDWIYQMDYFSAQGYGVVALDLLGYGATSKPSDTQQYRLKPMANEIVELLDHLSLSEVVGVGHDFGATLLSRMAAYQPLRFTKLVFLAVGPPRLGTPFHVNLVNQMTKRVLGFELLGYIPWLAGDNNGDDGGGDEDGNAQATLENNAHSAMSLMFCRDAQEWQKWFHPLGKMKEFVSTDQRLPIGSWYNAALQDKHLEAFGQRDGYKCVQWYRMWTKNMFGPDEVGWEDFQISQPVLLVVPQKPESAAQEDMLAAWTRMPLKTVRVESGHWVHLERAAETNEAIQEFICS